MLVKPEVLHAEIRDKEALYSSYMPFISGGCIFLPTDIQYDLNDSVFLILKLPFVNLMYRFKSRVVWVNPSTTNRNKPHGVGLKIEDDVMAPQMTAKIESIIAGMPSSKPTFTI